MGASQSSSNSKEKTGSTWTKQLYFDPEADKPAKEEYTLPDDQLLGKVKSLTKSDKQEHIVLVQVFKTEHKSGSSTWKDYVPTFRNRSVSWPQQNNDHTFLVICLENGSSFSLELNDGGIIIQRGTGIGAVKLFCRDIPRNVERPILTFHEQSSDTIVTLGNLLEWLHAMFKSWRNSDCYDFASEVFKHITDKELDIPKPAEVCGNHLKSDDAGEYKAYYTHDADTKKAGSKYMITEYELVSLLDSYDSDEEIKKVTAYKTPLSEGQLTFVLLYHLFIIFETDSFWWSIEKNDEGLTIQRSKDIRDVKDRYRQEPRLSKGSDYWKITEVNSDAGMKTMKQVIDWLTSEQWLFRTYHWHSSNCQHFGKAVFDFVSRERILKIAT